MRPDRIRSYISLAMKAGKVASGEFAAEKAVKEGRAAMVILARDASRNTKKKFTDMCLYYQVPVREYETKEELGHMIGRELRACLALTDAGLAKAIQTASEKEEDKRAEDI